MNSCPSYESYTGHSLAAAYGLGKVRGLVVLKFIRKVYERGKVTIPKELRELLHVNEGDLVEIEIISVMHKTDPGAASPPIRVRVEANETRVSALDRPAGGEA